MLILSVTKPDENITLSFIREQVKFKIIIQCIRHDAFYFSLDKCLISAMTNVWRFAYNVTRLSMHEYEIKRKTIHEDDQITL